MSIGSIFILNLGMIHLLVLDEIEIQDHLLQIGLAVIGGCLIYYGQLLKKYLNSISEILEKDGQVLFLVYKNLTRDEVSLEKTRTFTSMMILIYGFYILYYGVFIVADELPHAFWFGYALI